MMSAQRLLATALFLLGCSAAHGGSVVLGTAVADPDRFHETAWALFVEDLAVETGLEIELKVEPAGSAPAVFREDVQFAIVPADVAIALVDAELFEVLGSAVDESGTSGGQIHLLARNRHRSLPLEALLDCRTSFIQLATPDVLPALRLLYAFAIEAHALDRAACFRAHSERLRFPDNLKPVELLAMTERELAALPSPREGAEDFGLVWSSPPLSDWVLLARHDLDQAARRALLTAILDYQDGDGSRGNIVHHVLGAGEARWSGFTPADDFTLMPNRQFSIFMELWRLQHPQDVETFDDPGLAHLAKTKKEQRLIALAEEFQLVNEVNLVAYDRFGAREAKP